NVIRIAECNGRLISETSDLANVIFITAGQSVSDANGMIADSTPTVCVYSSELPFSRWDNWYQAGIDLVIPDRRQIPAASLDPRIKMRSRLHWMLADQEARSVNPDAMAL